MEPYTFLRIALCSVFLYPQIQGTEPNPEKDEADYAAYEPSQFFNNLAYDLVLNADATSTTPHFWGHVFITMKCIKKNNKLFLDQSSLEINEDNIEAWILNTSDSTERSITVHYGRKVSNVRGFKIKLEEYMQVDSTYKIKLEFSARIYYEDSGLVSKSYRLRNHNLRRMLYTRMRKLYAHHVIPCFNRVDMKATFKITIGHVQNVNSFTNAKFVRRKLVDNPAEWINYISSYDIEDVISKYKHNRNDHVETLKDLPQIWAMDEFAITDLISPFSVALAVLDFSSYEPTFLEIGPYGTDLRRVEIKTWAEKDVLDEIHVKKVQEVAARSLAFFSDFFDSQYHLGKLDLIMVPDDKITVENYYGVIYLGENAVKYVFTQSTRYQADRYSLVSKICQAMSRQWIGHFVTLYNWKEDWFYEGLHTYLQRYCATEIFPDWKVHIQLDLVDSFINLMRDEERGEAYDPILQFGATHITLNPETKSKVHLIIRMMSFILEFRKKLFQISLTNLINEFRKSSLYLRQVWDSWTKTAKASGGIPILPQHTDFHSIVNSWLFQRGHPLIKVARNKIDNEMNVYQTPFVFPDQKDSGRCWAIPFDLITKNSITHRVKVRKWLTCKNPNITFRVPNLKDDDWIIIGLQLHVPGRVQYDRESWSLIKTLFHDESMISNIDVFTRIHLIHDMFTLAEASYIDYDFVFETMNYISYEEDTECLHVIHQELERVRSRWIGTSLFEPFQEFIRNLIEPIFKKKISKMDGFMKSRQSRNMVEQIIVQIACTFELPNCKIYSENLLNDLMKLDDYEYANPIPELLRESFYCTAMKNADEKTYDFLLKQYNNDPTDKRILRALGCSKNPEILKKFLDWSLMVTNSSKSRQLSLDVFQILSSSSEGYKLILAFFRIRRMRFANKDLNTLNEFITQLGSDITIDDFLIKALKGTKKQDDLDMLLNFSKTLSDRKAEKVKMEEEVVNIVRRNISWLKKKETLLLEYLRKTPKVNK